METVTAYTPHKFTDSAHNAFLTRKPKRTTPLNVCRPLNSTPCGDYKRGLTPIRRIPGRQENIQEKNFIVPQRKQQIYGNNSTD